MPLKSLLFLKALFLLSFLISSVSGAEQSTRVELVAQVGHASGIVHTAVSPDGEILLSASNDGIVKLWSTETGRLIRSFQSGANSIVGAAISRSNKTIALASGENSLSGTLGVSIWDLSNSTLKKQFTLNGSLNSRMEFVDDEKGIAFALGENLVYYSVEGEDWRLIATSVFPDPSKTILQPDLTSALAATRQRFLETAVSPDGKRLAFAMATPSGPALISLVEFPRLTIRSVTNLQEHPTKIHFIGSNRLIALANRLVHTLDLGRSKSTSVHTPSSSANLVLSPGDALSPDATAAIVIQSPFPLAGERARIPPFLSHSTSLNSSEAAVVDVSSGRVVHRKQLPTVSGRTILDANTIVQEGEARFVPFFRSGKAMVAASHGRDLYLQPLSTAEERQHLAGDASYTNAIAVSLDGRSFATAGTSLRVWDMSQGKVQNFFGADFFTAVTFCPDKACLIAGHSDGHISAWDLIKGAIIYKVRAHRTSVTGLSFLPDGENFISTGADGSISTWVGGNGHKSKGFVTSSNSVNSFSVSRDGGLVISTDNRGKIHLWDRASGSPAKTLHGTGSRATVAAFVDQTRDIVSGHSNGSIYIWRDGEPDGSRLATEEGDSITALAAPRHDQLILVGHRSGKINAVDIATGSIIRSYVGHSGPIEHLVRDSSGHHFLTSGADNSVRLWSINDSSDRIRFLSTNTGSWALMTPAGYFNHGGQGDLPFHLVRGHTTVSIAEVFEHLYRPDLIEATLNGDPEGKHKDSAARLNLSVILDSGPAPQVDHLPSMDERAGDTVRLSVRITGRGGGIGSKVVWRVNGIAQGSAQRVDAASGKSPIASVVVTRTFQLSKAQTNLIEVSAYNNAGLLASAPLRIHVDNFGTTTSPRPTMFVLALGVNSYRMTRYKLNYAASDASTFAKALSVVGSSLFSSVETQTLLDEQVHPANIEKSIDAISRRAKPDDVFVLFLGGHGKSINGRYFYYPQTIDFELGHTVETHGIGQDKWEQWLARIPVLKSLLVIDTCEGDAFRGVRGSDAARQTAMAQLQYATGRNVIAASREAAYEGYQGHGVLTYAILEALDKGNGDPYADPRVGVTALAHHVGLRVPEITQKSFGVLQNPTRKLAGNDFPLGVRQPVLSSITGSRQTIPKEPTHVLIRSEALRSRPDLAVDGTRELQPGTQVRALHFYGSWVAISREGQALGFVRLDALAKLQ